jgi:hypothetical protein
VRLELMAPGMARKKGNTTRFDRARRRMLWHLEWKFAGAGVSEFDPQ